MITTAEFYRQFPDEESCQNHLKKSREENGIHCKKCGSTDHYWLKNKNLWQCKKCKFRTTLRSGTLFHASNVKLFKWFQAIYFMTSTHKAVSAKEMQLKLGMKRYQPVWYMMHKIRLLMNTFNSTIDVENESYLGHLSLINRLINSEEENMAYFSNKVKKHSEVILLMEKGGRPFNKVRFKIFPKSKMYLRNSQSYEIGYSVSSVKNSMFKYLSAFHRKNNPVTAFLNGVKENNSKWVKNLIENLKGVVHTIYHRVSAKYLQLYLDEFSFKYNIKDFESRRNKLFISGLRFYW